MKFKTFLKVRTNRKTKIINTNVITTYKLLYWLTIIIFVLTVTNMILLIIGSMFVIVTILLSIFLMIIVPIWITYSKYILKSDKVLAFIVGTLFTIMIFALAYYILQDYYDGDAFNINDKLNKSSLLVWFYYSVIVFSTVGFGDITPIHPIAIILTTSEIILHYIFIIFGFSLLSKQNSIHDEIIISEFNRYICRYNAWINIFILFSYSCSKCILEIAFIILL